MLAAGLVSELEVPDLSQDPPFCSYDPRQCWTHICRLDLPPLGSAPSVEELFLVVLVFDIPVLFIAAFST